MPPFWFLFSFFYLPFTALNVLSWRTFHSEWNSPYSR